MAEAENLAATRRLDKNDRFQAGVRVVRQVVRPSPAAPFSKFGQMVDDILLRKGLAPIFARRDLDRLILRIISDEPNICA